MVIAAPRIVIVGGSIAGLSAAALLALAGADVQVYERSRSTLSGRGAGIVTHPETHAILARLGSTADPASLGHRVENRRVLDLDGRVLAEARLPQVLAQWSRLYDTLRSLLPPNIVTLDSALAGLERSGDGLQVRFVNGRTVPADLVVGADGLFSTVRRDVAPTIEPAYAGYVAWRGLVDEADLSSATRSAITGHFAFCLPKGEQILGYPVRGDDEDDRSGRRQFNFVWYRPAAADELARLFTDIDGTEHRYSIPPHRIRPGILAAMRADAERLLAPAFAEVVQKTRQPFLQAILDLETPAMTAQGRIALVGDAAFIARPHVGMGVTKAMADGAALADALVAASWDIPAALAAYEATRRPYGTAIVARARALGAYMQAQQFGLRQRDDAERHRRPEAVIVETAVPPPDLT